MATHNELISLVDYLAAKVGCMYLSDLHDLSKTERILLAHHVEKLTAERFSLHEWNDALQYIFQAPQEKSSADAQRKLVSLFRK